MKKSLFKTPLDQNRFKYRIVYESDDAALGTSSYKNEQFGLLSSIVNNPGMLDCGHDPFEKLRMYHDGAKWIIEMEAVGT